MSKEQIKPRGTAGDIPVFCRYDEIVQIEKAIENPKNPNTHGEKQLQLLSQIIKSQGWRAPITISTRSGFIVKGHGRLQAARLLNAEFVPVEYQNYQSEAEEYADLIADNRLAELSQINDEMLKELMLQMDGEALDLTGYTSDEIDALLYDNAQTSESDRVAEAISTLQEKFIVPPFSILDSRQGYWRDRKKAWKNLGIKSEEGREDKLLFQSNTASDPQFYQMKTDMEKRIGHNLSTAEFLEKYYVPSKSDLSTSIFDPVLCEVTYRWFCPHGGLILDPFAGGSVRGITAEMLDYKYTGIDLREKQVEANKEQVEHLNNILAFDCAMPTINPTWIVGDSEEKILELKQEYDFIFSCPPYADLEKYSDNPRDLSNMDYEDFKRVYFSIIKKAVSKLKDNRFAAFVVGEVRDKNGIYRNFLGDTIKAFTDAGLKFYNEFIYITQTGGLSIRVGRQFTKARKNGKTHQNMYVFMKGNPVSEISKWGG